MTYIPDRDPDITARVYVFGEAKARVLHFKDVDHAYSFFRGYGLVFNDKVFHLWRFPGNPVTGRLIPASVNFYNFFGEYIFPADFMDAVDVKESANVSVRFSRWSRRDDYVFRDGPVPCTGVRRRYSNWLRCPKTTQEIASNDFVQFDDDQIEASVRVRGRRTRAHLRTCWDDISRHRERCWKRHRPQQWRVV